MDAKLKADWVKALRSGEYRQARYQLQDGNGFCCLGVLCEVAGIKIAANGRDTLTAEGREVQSYSAIYRLLGDPAKGEKLPVKNDSGDNFTDIADWIEQNL